MNLNKNRRSLTQRPVALMLAASMAMPLFLTGCGGKKDESAAPAVDDTRGGTVTPPGPKMDAPKTGMSTTKKVVILAGIAAAYFWYKHHQKAEQNKDKTAVLYLKSHRAAFTIATPRRISRTGSRLRRTRWKFPKPKRRTTSGFRAMTTRPPAMPT